MKITNSSNNLIGQFVKNKCIQHSNKLTNNTKAIVTHLFLQMVSGVSAVNVAKGKLTVKNIENASKIPKPQTITYDAIPSQIRKQIDDHIVSSITYTFDIFKRKITIIFLLEEEATNKVIKTYNEYVKNMLVWLYIVDQHASNKCSNNLTVFLYHTSLKKMLPNLEGIVLNENHVNTAFTKTCPVNTKSEIVVFRKEEWFKVFIHETFHNFGLDFSGSNLSKCNSKILSIFPVNSNVNLYESYTEFWARLINVMFCCYANMKNKTSTTEFISWFQFLMDAERSYSLFQMVKILKFMKLNYKLLHEQTNKAQELRNSLYKEDTSVLSYYIIGGILMYNYQDLLVWCDSNNDLLLCFKKTATNLNKYCEFIERKYKTKQLNDAINCVTNMYNKLDNIKFKLTKNEKYIAENTRMTLCELG